MARCNPTSPTSVSTLELRHDARRLTTSTRQPVNPSTCQAICQPASLPVPTAAIEGRSPIQTRPTDASARLPHHSAAATQSPAFPWVHPLGAQGEFATCSGMSTRADGAPDCVTHAQPRSRCASVEPCGPPPVAPRLGRRRHGPQTPQVPRPAPDRAPRRPTHAQSHLRLRPGAEAEVHTNCMQGMP